jgi:hypothetical protein
MVTTTWICGVYVLGRTSPYFSRGPGPARAFGYVLGVLQLTSEGYASRFRASKFAVLVGAAALSYLALAVFGGGGMLWLTDTRTAYLENRTGAGQFWLLTIWFLMTAMVYYLWARRPRGLRLVGAVVASTVGAYLTGSKYVILCAFITALTYYHFLVKPVPTVTVIVSGVVAVAAFFGLLFFQSSMTALNVLSYFENFDVTTRFISRFDEFGYRYGAGWLSQFWFYVPRALYPDKPREYGSLLIPAHLFPGAHEQGYAPGFLGWSLSYLDFGLVGVFVMGYLASMAQRAVYEHYLARRRSLFAFLFMIQFCLWSVLPFATIAVMVIWSLATATLLRLVVVRRTDGDSGSWAPHPSPQTPLP